jgi:hypothetical protein
LHDPIEDDPKRTWTDYRENYLKTLTASLLHPEVSHYEVAPWPKRIFEGAYPSEDGSGKEGIPADYATVLLTIMHTLGNMDQPDVEVFGNSTPAGVLLADSAMYQRVRPGVDTAGFMMKYDGTNAVELTDEYAMELLHFSPFYGLTLPLVKYGLPVRPVQLDNVRRFPRYLDDYRVLVLSYEFMKPEHPDLHPALAQWVRDGGALVYVGDDSDPYHRVKEWWNRGKRIYRSPREHLFECLGLEADLPEGITRVGSGLVSFLRMRTDRLTESAEMAQKLRDAVKEAMDVLNDPQIRWTPANYFMIRRGPYVIASVMEESVHDRPLALDGMYVDLLQPGLPVVRNVSLAPGKQALLYDLASKAAESGRIIASASRIEHYAEDARSLSFTAKGPRAVHAAARIRCPGKPSGIAMNAGGPDAALPFEWDEATGTVLIRYENRPAGVRIAIHK